MSFVDAMLFLIGVSVLMISLDFILSKISSEWKLTQWEEDEQNRL